MLRSQLALVNSEVSLLHFHSGLGEHGSSSLSVPVKSKSAKEKRLSAAAAKLRLLKRLRCTLRYEKKAWAMGARLVAGVDEVGRGSLFGPVVAAAAPP